ncbi:ribosome-associated translation inhibitor RaiA [Candidatus Binatia bacterium]|nr:ribosome-associated translation inhibitor RaiA [Candidatus Binatia bacterium]
MHVMVTFRHVDPSDGLRRHAEAKLRRVGKLLRGAAEAHVILSVVKRRHVAEVQVSADHVNTTATEETDDLYSAIDLAVDKLVRQVKRRAEKIRERKGAGTRPRATPAAGPSPRPAGIRTQRVAVKPMSIEEAVLQFGRANRDFLLFRNASTDAVSLLYRRKDGGFGLLVPELS